MRTLFNIALSNFVVPAMFSIAQFVCVYRNVNMVVLDQIMLVNMMVATFGVAFATIWAGSTNREEAQILDSKHINTASSFTAGFRGGPGYSAYQSSTVTIPGTGSMASPSGEYASK